MHAHMPMSGPVVAGLWCPTAAACCPVTDAPVDLMPLRGFPRRTREASLPFGLSAREAPAAAAQIAAVGGATINRRQLDVAHGVGCSVTVTADRHRAVG
jgi:hypothetical protein